MRTRRPNHVKLTAPAITWRTDDLTIGRVETILGRDFVAGFFEDPDREHAISVAVGRARGAWEANERENHAAYRSLARLLGRRDEGAREPYQNPAAPPRRHTVSPHAVRAPRGFGKSSTIAGRRVPEGPLLAKFNRSIGDSHFADRVKPYKVRTSCGHIVIRHMRTATAGVSWSEDVVIEAPGGAPCPACAGRIDNELRESRGPEPVDDPFYVIQGSYSDGRISDEYGYDDESAAVREAQRLLMSPYFEGENVRVITRDGEGVWDSLEGGDVGMRRDRATGMREAPEASCTCHKPTGLAEKRFPDIRRLPDPPSPRRRRARS